MTDWIEVLLGQQRTREAEETLPELRPAGPMTGRPAGEEGDAEATGGQPMLTGAWPAQLAEAMWQATAEEQRAAERGAEPAQGAETAPTAAAQEAEEALRRRGGERQDSAGQLWRALLRGEAALGRRGTEQAPAPWQAPAGGADAAELDRLVERDARRYDGGFRLY